MKKENNIIEVNPEREKLGFVGVPNKINSQLINDAINKNEVPIIAPLGVGKNQQTYNINGDTAASAIAKKLKSRRLLLMTNVEGVYDNIFYNFQLIWNNDKRTYFLNDIHNENYETNIIGNITTETSTKEKNTCFLKGETFISYVFKNPITFKKLIDDCF